jgi:hypothetical protein
MRQVAGRLRLDLAQYRELAAFASFSSDLDKQTLAQLQQGQRMTELLKQDQYAPMKVEQQVSILFAGARGLLDDIPVEKIREFEKGFHQYMGSTGKEVLAELAQKKEIDDALEESLKKAVLDYKRGSGLAEKKEGAGEADAEEAKAAEASADAKESRVAEASADAEEAKAAEASADAKESRVAEASADEKPVEEAKEA